jgi:uncharacterized protein (TIRG00374 family)
VTARRYINGICLLLGALLLAIVLGHADLGEAWAGAVRIGWGMAAVLGLYFVAFAIDSFTWQLALLNVPLDAAWFYRTWKVRMVGEAFNTLIPAAGFGGEPVKAYLYHKHYGVGYLEGYASLILGKTVNMIALVVFLAAGFALMLGSPALAATHKTAAGVGLAALAAGVSLFFAVQRLRVSTLAGTWIGRRRFGRRLKSVLHHVREMDERLFRFYALHRGRFLAAVLLALVNWLLGAAEIYLAMLFLGHPVPATDAWIIEAVAQLARAGSFFIPAHVGAQEGAFFVVYAALTGSPTLGVAVAFVRRFREALWLAWGFALGALYAARPARGAVS